MLWVHGQYKYLYSYSAVIDFKTFDVYRVNTIRCIYVGWMLYQHLWQWPSIRPALAQRVVCDGFPSEHLDQGREPRDVNKKRRQNESADNTWQFVMTGDRDVISRATHCDLNKSRDHINAPVKMAACDA